LIKTVFHPLHVECDLVTELAIRAIKAVVGIFALAITALPALFGRIAQIIHFHAISANNRAHPPEVKVSGMSLPELEVYPMLASQKALPVSFRASQREAKNILRWGFYSTTRAAEQKLPGGIEVSVANVAFAVEASDTLRLSLDLREGGIAYVSNRALNDFSAAFTKVFAEKTGRNFSDQTDIPAQRELSAARSSTLRELYYQNGYQAIKHKSDRFGKEEHWVVCDSFCMSLLQVLPPIVVPPIAGQSPAEKCLQQEDCALSVLRFFSSKDLAKLAGTSKNFYHDSRQAAKREINSKNTLSLRELIDFAKLINPAKSIANFEKVSSYLDQLTGLDLSNLDFTTNSFQLLGSLTADRRSQITSLNFTNAQNLTMGKFKSLSKLFSPAKINYLDFTGTNCWPFDMEDFQLNMEYFQQYNAFRNGHGTLAYGDGNKYEGAWLEGKRHGQGTFTFAHGDKIEVAWLEGESHGQGTFIFANGYRHEGFWFKGKYREKKA
jgi:hypothetical protein